MRNIGGAKQLLARCRVQQQFPEDLRERAGSTSRVAPPFEGNRPENRGERAVLLGLKTAEDDASRAGE